MIYDVCIRDNVPKEDCLCPHTGILLFVCFAYGSVSYHTYQDTRKNKDNNMAQHWIINCIVADKSSNINDGQHHCYLYSYI